MITISNLNKSFKEQKVLSGISLSFDRKGCISAILGPNGSGKTTLIKTVLGMVLPDKGEILVGQTPIRKQWAYRAMIDYLPQIARFPENLKVKELINMIKDIRQGVTREQELIELFDLHPFMDQKLGKLSGGTKQKVNLTIALMYDSPIMILDEPTSGLDPIALIRLKQLLMEEKKRGKLILMTSHIMSLVEEMADEIVFLLDGQVYFRGSKKELTTQYNEEGLEAAIAAILMGKRTSKLSEAGIRLTNGKVLRRRGQAILNH